MTTLRTKFIPALTKVPGYCIGDTYQTPDTRNVNCGDLESNDPTCQECQDLCYPDIECAGFFVKLDRNKKGKLAVSRCFFRKGRLTAKAHQSSVFNCFLKRKYRLNSLKILSA